MEFIIKQAGGEHLREIMEVMADAEKTVEKKEWFASDDEAFIKDVLDKNGFIIGAWEQETKEMAGFFAVVFPDKTDNMGKYAGLSGEELKKVIYMDSAAVKAKYRGNRLQQKMLLAAEAELDRRLENADTDCQYRMCSVHPDNSYSLHNMEKNGYGIAARAKLYGGLDRYVLCKNVYRKDRKNSKK